MPKSLDKTKGARKRKKTPTNSSVNTESDASDSRSCPKKKKTPKRRNCLSGIEMSKQLATEVQRKRQVRARISTKTNVEPRLCGNGKPMPSLAELEAMYQDSDDDENPPPQTTQKIPLPTERCETPEQKPLLPTSINIDSPESLKKLTSKVIDIISKTIVLDDDDDDGPPPPVIPQKKPKKSDTPYIVGCKNRPQIPWVSKAKIGVDKEKYGIDPNQPPDDDEKKIRKRRGEKTNLSKSIFNAKSDEIAERLKELDTIPNVAPSSPDSTSTVDYDYNSSVRIPRNFSPLPSTSNDTDVILENDRLFNKSLMDECESLPNENSPQGSPIIPQASPQGSPDEVEVVDIPCETVVIDDTFPEVNMKGHKRKSTELDDDCFIIVDSEIKRKRSNVKAESPVKDDIYSSIDLTQTFDNEVYEINDDEIDDLIAENKAIIEKDRKKNSIDCVTFVGPNVIVLESENKLQQTQSSSSSQLNVPTASVSQPSTSSSDITAVVYHPPASLEVECVEVADHTNTSINNTTTPGQPSKSNKIAEVVNNFFTQSPSNDRSCRILNESRGTSTVDLTSSQETMMSRISSWIFSLESYLSGRHNNRRRRSNGDQVVVVNDCQRTIPNSNETENFTNPVILCFPNNTRSQKQSTQQLSESSSQSRAIPSNVVPTDPTATQPSPGLTLQQNPHQRSLGDCPICMDNLANNAVASTICGHVFCMACIKAAIRANGKKCPTCRKALKGVGYHQLFL